MRVLFDIYHPAQVHLFKNLIRSLEEKGHEITVVTKDKDLTNVLLDSLHIPYTCLSGIRGSLYKMGFELALRDWKILRLHSKYRFDLAIGSSVSIAHLTALAGVYSINFCEDDDDVVPLYAWLTYPFASKVVHPQGLKCKRFLSKRVYHPSYQKLAYLHPANFEPDPSILAKYDLEPQGYSIVRRSSYTAYHDSGQGGFTNTLLEKIQQRLSDAPVVLSIENQKNYQIDPIDMHHILSYAKLVVCDSQSMAVESAMLGTPSLRMSSFTGKIAVLNELEHKYQLTVGFSPGSEEEFLLKLNELLASPDLQKEWQERRERMLKDKIDLNAWMLELIEDVEKNIRQ
ncbi:MAG: DUF354 domain-containing protein [Verrucomicrobiota bacterium]